MFTLFSTPQVQAIVTQALGEAWPHHIITPEMVHIKDHPEPNAVSYLIYLGEGYIPLAPNSHHSQILYLLRGAIFELDEKRMDDFQFTCQVFHLPSGDILARGIRVGQGVEATSVQQVAKKVFSGLTIRV